MRQTAAFSPSAPFSSGSFLLSPPAPPPSYNSGLKKERSPIEPKAAAAAWWLVGRRLTEDGRGERRRASPATPSCARLCPPSPQLTFTADFAARLTFGVPLTICELGGWRWRWRRRGVDSGREISRLAGLQTLILNNTDVSLQESGIARNGEGSVSEALAAFSALLVRGSSFLSRAGR